MVAKEVKITNEQGLHMRPAGVFAKEMTKFNSDVTLVYNGKRVNAKSVMLIIAACIKCGAELTIECNGADEEAVKTLGAPYERLRDAFRVSVPDTAAATKLILRQPELFTDYEITKGKMDDVFLAVTGRTLKGGEQK